jgi:hypothetical protein
MYVACYNSKLTIIVRVMVTVKSYMKDATNVHFQEIFAAFYSNTFSSPKINCFLLSTSQFFS